ncbi:hypothetical protein Hypma_006336 [Hypsizygus marmoreus]|uniref:Protein kinase domain-containing protein n=1 Tax=Hypsizygus marmoreus TaxID=39966 RepID=A0A369JY36_HYPMA|nr:hypothetical protein Hypma_006336 [Hypsizygus marmoreus]
MSSTAIKPGFPEVILRNETGDLTAILALSSVTINGMAFSSGSEIPLELSRSISFPANRKTYCRKTPCDERDGWASLPLPLQGLHLELELGDLVAEGRTSVVYGARMIHVLENPNGPTITGFPVQALPSLCIKLAKPTFCRSLAREAWFYERLPEDQNYQGFVIPRCYGLFTVPLQPLSISLGSDIKIIPWEMLGTRAPFEYPEGSEGWRYGDHLPDDFGWPDDGRRDKADSPWNEWRPSASLPVVSVLILERLGEVYSQKEFHENPRSMIDIADLIDDLSSAAISHDDLKYNNVLHATDQSFVCPRHQYAHAWRFVDFDRSARWGKNMECDAAPMTKVARMSFLEVDDDDWFWGIPL